MINEKPVSYKRYSSDNTFIYLFIYDNLEYPMGK